MEREQDGTFLHQRNKIEDILNAYEMKDAKLVVTPLELSYLSSTVEENKVLPNNALYG